MVISAISAASRITSLLAGISSISKDDPISGAKVRRAILMHTFDGQVDDLTNLGLKQANVAAMGAFDWIALLLATAVVALTIGGELKVSERTTKPALYPSFQVPQS